MRDFPLVSVYLPTRNRAELLRRAIDSVLNQSYRNLELIVVNDGSTDSTSDFLERLANDEHRVSVFNMTNPVGAPAARNRAISVARGEFITGIDDDDEFASDRIESFVTEWTAIEASGDSVSCLFSESMHYDGNQMVRAPGLKERVNYEDLFAYNYIGNQVFCPREYLLAIGGFDEKMKAWQDLETFMRLTQRFGAAGLVRKATYVWYMERGRDRISTRTVLLRSAYDRIVEKHEEAAPTLKRRLFFQMFSPTYRALPTAADWFHVFAWADPIEVGRLLRTTIRNWRARRRSQKFE
jgi:glycosyltransferase involved in cell wall biosynthesis